MENLNMTTRIGHRVETMKTDDLRKEFAKNEAEIEALMDTNRTIENELHYRKTAICESCNGKGYYDAGILIGYVSCPDCSQHTEPKN